MVIAFVPVPWFGPMFDDRPTIMGLPPSVVTLLVAVALLVVGLLWLRHLLRPDELTRGEAHWRYRERGLLDRLDEALLELHPPRRTWRWWATRLELALAIGALALPLLTLLQPVSMGGGAQFDPPLVLLIGIGYAGMLVGLRWMVRIYRAPAEGARGASWRFRDHG